MFSFFVIQRNNLNGNESYFLFANVPNSRIKRSFYTILEYFWKNKNVIYNIKKALIRKIVFAKFHSRKTNFDTTFTKYTIHRFNFEKGTLTSPMKALYIQLLNNKQRFEIQGDDLPLNLYVRFGCFKDNTGCMSGTVSDDNKSVF